LAKKVSKIQQAQLAVVMKDPVLWAKHFLITNNALTKKMGPWEARDYQIEMMRDPSLKKVYRCGRRIGKSETMIVEALHKAFTHKLYRVLFVTPYENQVNLVFMRMKELIGQSPLVKAQLVTFKSSPYTVEFKNGSKILGFTTGAASGSGAASVRGQRADYIFMDELDYMGADDYSTISAIAGERADIGMTASSTPTGKRGTFYEMCTNPKYGYTEHYHPSTDNPGWCQEMEDKFRAEMTPSQYDHEILAIFGTEEAGVFPKDKVDMAWRREWYAYNPLTDTQLRSVAKGDLKEPLMMDWDEYNPAPPNKLRCVGVDWDAHQASSSIIVLDYDIKASIFRVIKRIEVPRSEYTIDNAVNWVIKVNQIYNPAWIFCDRGYGDYQIERLHIYGDQHPSTGLKEKVVGYQFKQTLDIRDPTTGIATKEPMKPFMVNQLVIAFDRGRISLSPFDEVLHKQIIDYTVERISQSGQPVYTSVNEHFVDALGLAYLAFVLNFSKITRQIKLPEYTSRIERVDTTLGVSRAAQALNELNRPHQMASNPWAERANKLKEMRRGEPKEKGQQWIKVPLKPDRPSSYRSVQWGSRSGYGTGGRTMW